MFILDTDHLSILEWGGTESLRLQERLAGQPPEEVATTIINFEEQMRGWLAYVARARSLPQQVEAYHRLRRHLDNYRLIPVLDFDERAAAELARLQKGRVRIGTMDLKIAAIALAQGATLLTRNLADFAQVPGLEIEDWTQ
jgi:tRNA(fMet)-specific endonuclease VapC